MASNSNIDTEGATQHLRDILKLDRPGNSTEEQTLHCETVKPASALVCEPTLGTHWARLCKVAAPGFQSCVRGPGGGFNSWGRRGIFSNK
ncbi:enhancer of mRNA-decapping protein 4 isoform X1 [Lates japonicus]|uniref:Enhancer of mRNA-decapping protein 4 isoform X1 n=1 Tax=Lates japonicus TaxID=270547 RepID=A0AAD3RMV2_LATJO|nr:enhancer of mRNA-decapping protein 4 isoform X1 [Lates japonicus]